MNTLYSESTLGGGNYSLNCRTGELTSEITTLRLSSSETSLLAYLMKKPGVSFAFQTLRTGVFPEAKDDSTVELYLFYLRKKLRYLQADATISLADGCCIYQETCGE